MRENRIKAEVGKCHTLEVKQRKKINDKQRTEAVLNLHCLSFHYQKILSDRRDQEANSELFTRAQTKLFYLFPFVVTSIIT